MYTQLSHLSLSLSCCNSLRVFLVSVCLLWLSQLNVVKQSCTLWWKPSEVVWSKQTSTFNTADSVEHGCLDQLKIWKIWLVFPICLYTVSHMRGSLRKTRRITSSAAKPPPSLLFILSPMLNPFLSTLCFDTWANQISLFLHCTLHRSKCKKKLLREQRRLRVTWNLFSLKSPWVSAGGRCVSWLGAPSCCSSQWSTPLGCSKLHSAPDYTRQQVL